MYASIEPAKLSGAAMEMFNSRATTGRSDVA